MTEAEQWLSDLEAKAKAATPGPWVWMGYIRYIQSGVVG